MEPNTRLQSPVLSTLSEKLGYQNLQSWQIELTEEILKGKALGTRTQIPTRHMLDTLGVQTTSDSNVPSGYRLGTF